MQFVEGKPEDILRSFRELNDFDQPFLCVLASNRVRDSEILRKLIERVLEIDSVLAGGVGFLILGRSIDRAAFTPDTRGRGRIFPAVLPRVQNKSRKIQIDFVRDLSEEKYFEDEVNLILKKHLRYSEDFCKHLDLDPAGMPYAILAVRGITQPFAVALPRDLDEDKMDTFLRDLSSIVKQIDSKMNLQLLNLPEIAYVVNLANSNERKISKLKTECQKQIERSARYKPSLEVFQEMMIVLGQDGRLDLAELVKVEKFPLDLNEIRNDQNIAKAERLSRIIAAINDEMAELVNRNRNLTTNTITYFRQTAEASELLVSEVESMSRRGGRSAVDTALKAVDGAERIERLLKSFIKIGGRLFGIPA